MFRSTLVFVCLLPLLLTSCDGKVTALKKTPQANHGKIDLRDWSFENNGSVKLDGKWEFYWNRHYKSEDFNLPQKQPQTDYFNIPGIWNDKQVNGQSIGQDGFATFRLVMALAPTDHRLALSLKPMASAYTLFVDGQLLASNGITGKSKETTTPLYLNKIADFSTSKESIELLLWISNFHIEKGGPWTPIEIGLNEDLQRAKNIRLAFDMLLFGALFIMALYHFELFSKRRKEVSNLFFGLFCFVVTIRIGVTNERYFSLFFQILIGYSL